MYSRRGWEKEDISMRRKMETEGRKKGALLFLVFVNLESAD